MTSPASAVVHSTTSKPSPLRMSATKLSLQRVVLDQQRDKIRHRLHHPICWIMRRNSLVHRWQRRKHEPGPAIQYLLHNQIVSRMKIDVPGVVMVRIWRPLGRNSMPTISMSFSISEAQLLKVIHV